MAKKTKKNALLQFLPILLVIVGIVLLLLLPAVVYKVGGNTTTYNGIKAIFGYQKDVGLGIMVTYFEFSTVLFISLILSFLCGVLPIFNNKLLNLVAGTSGVVATVFIALITKLAIFNGTLIIGIGAILGAVLIGLSALISLYLSYKK